MIAPPDELCRAFGVDAGAATLLDGGQGRTWRVGDLVLKPVDHVVEHAWVSDVFSGWSQTQVRVPEPVCTLDGSRSYAGWAAHRWLEGRTASMRSNADKIRHASDCFHEAVADLAPPEFIARREDAWSYGDRVAWEDAPPLGEARTVRQIEALRAAYTTVTAPAQVIHGDIGGNVLLEPGLPPAVIDWPPYTRPVGFAPAVAVVDAVRWEGLSLAFVDAWADIDEWEQLLARALVYRIATAGVGQSTGTSRLGSAEHARASAPLAELLLSRLA
ncbi:MAG: phosphotransferase [Propionibacteriales bacterium]|nr:phosphotransferase [Propionibacteriales bacterium]